MADLNKAAERAAPELAPCPFCAASDAAVHEHCTGGSYMVLCHNCTAEGPLHDTRALAAEWWNRRTAPVSAPMGEELPAHIVINFDGSTSTRISEYENDLENDLAAIRDLFPTPDFGELHNLWSEACSEPRAVAAYVKAQFDTQAERIRQLERELAERRQSIDTQKGG